MKKEEVRELAQQFVSALEEEKKLRAKLLDLKMTGDLDVVEKNLAKHDSMIDSISELREKKMLPILETLGAFISENTGTARSPQQRLRDAVASGKEKVADNRIRAGMPGKKRTAKASKKAKATDGKKKAAKKKKA